MPPASRANRPCRIRSALSEALAGVADSGYAHRHRATLRTCFTPRSAPHLPTSWSTATEKPGPSAASGFAPGCGAAITRRPGKPRASGDPVSARSARSAGAIRGPERTVHIRTAEHAGHIYLDLADEHWRAIDIGPDGWRVIECPPVRFRRPAGMLPLPIPERGGSIETLHSFLNLASRNDFVLVVAWLLAALRSGGHIRFWRYPASRARQRPSSRSCSRR